MVRPASLRVGAAHCSERPAHFVDLAAAHRDQFGQDGHGDFFGRDGADVKADGRAQLLDPVGRDAGLDERVGEPGDLGAAADEADIAEGAARQRAQHVEVLPMAAREHDDVRRRRGCRRSRTHSVEAVDHDLVGGREALVVGELLPVVDDVQAEADGRRDLAELKADVAGAEDVQVRAPARSAR